MGLFDKLKKGIQSIKEISEQKTPQTQPQPVQQVEKIKRYPDELEGSKVRYIYRITPKETEPGKIKSVLGNREKFVEVSTDGDDLIFSFEGECFAKSTDQAKAKMVNDFVKRGDPIRAILMSDAETINLRFYRDNRKYAEKREQTVVQLTGFRGKGRQETLAYVSEGDELKIDDVDNRIDVYTWDEEIIGSLPAKVSKRVLDEGMYALYIEKMDTEQDDEYNDIYIPTVRIYW